jgi:uncharacterized protein YdaU (DUF1376 family)
MKIRRVDFSPDEWIAGCVGLDNAERGLYITACALIYSHGGPIEIEHLRASCRDHGGAFKRQLNRLQTLGKLTANGSQITNKRCENELENANKRSENARQNVARRWNNNEVDDTKPIQPVKLRRNANHQPSSTNHQNNPPKPPLRGGARQRKTNGHDQWGLANMTDRELSARFNATNVGDPEHEAIRKILHPGSSWAGI